MDQDTLAARLPKRKTVYLAHLLVVAAFAAQLFAYRHGLWIDQLRADYRAKGNTIDIPEALYFDMKAAEIILPLHLLCILLQVVSLVVFLSNQKGAGWLCKLAFWMLWLAPWGFCCYWLRLE